MEKTADFIATQYTTRKIFQCKVQNSIIWKSEPPLFFRDNTDSSLGFPTEEN